MSFKNKITYILDKSLSSEMFSYKTVFSMLFPLILDMFFINIINLLTTSMISSSGENSVAAVSMINPISTLVMCLLNAVAAGGTVIVAQCKGRGDDTSVKKAAGHTLTITISLYLIICTLIILTSNPLASSLYNGADIPVLEKAFFYLKGSCISLIAFSFYSAIFAIFRGLGENKLCLRLTIYINVSYFILSYIFINILKLDILGTILALVLARILGSSVALFYLITKRNIICISLSDIFSIDTNMFKNMFKLCIPFASEQLFLYGGNILVQKYMVLLSTTAIAANAIANSIFGIIYAAPYAVGNLATTVIGQCVGANKRDLVRMYGKRLLALSTIITLISICVFVPFLNQLIHVFNPSEEAYPIIRELLFIAISFMPFFWPASNIIPFTLRSASDAVFPSVVSLVTMWVIRVFAGYYVSIILGFGIKGVWYCMVFEWIVRSILFGIRFMGNSWINKHMI